MHLRSRKGAVEESSVEDLPAMTLLQSIIDQESETTDDARQMKNQNNSFDVNRRDKGANEKMLPSVKNCGDLRLARSLTNGRKPSSCSSNSSRLSVSSGNSLRSSSESTRQLVPPPLQSPYEANHKHRMVTKYRELGRMLYDVMGPQSMSLPRQGWVLPVQSYQTPKHSVRGHPLLLRSCFERSLSASGGVADDRGRLRSKREKEEEDIEIVSEGSRTETPMVEIVSIVDDTEFPGSANSSGKRVTFNPEATINEPYAGSFARRWNDKSNMQGQEIEPIRRAKTDTSLLKVHRSKRNKENELRSKDLDEEQTMSGRYSLDGQLRMKSLSRSGSRGSPKRSFERSFDGTNSSVSSSGSMRRSRSPRSSRRLLASWSQPLLSDSIDKHILLTDHHLNSIGNVEIRKWLEQKNRLLRKQKREEKRLERMIQREESEKQREKNEHLLDYQEKARLWMKERKRENLLKKRLSKQLKASTCEIGDRETRRRLTELTRVSSLNRKKTGASQELERNTLKGKTVGAKSDRRLRAKSAPCEMRENSRGRSSVREGRGGNKERQKMTAYKEEMKVDREDSKSGGTGANAENDEGRRARERSKAKGGKSLSKSVQLDSATDSEKLHNKHTKGKTSSQSSKDRLDPQGSEFKETDSDVGDAEREVDISTKLFNSLRRNGSENSDDGINKEAVDEESEAGKDYHWKKDGSPSDSEHDDGESENKSQNNERRRKNGQSRSGVDSESYGKEESRVGSRSSRSHSQTSSESDRDDGASENTNRTNKLRQKRESYSEVDGEFYRKKKSPRPHSQESGAERNESRSLTVREDVDKKENLYDINDHGDIQLHHKRISFDSTASREYGGQAQLTSRKSSPKGRNDEHSSISDGNASGNKNRHKEMEGEYSDKEKIESSRHFSQSLAYEKTPTPEASEKNFRTRTALSKDDSNKLTGSSGHESELQRIASKNSMNSTHGEERNKQISSGSPRSARNGDPSDSAKTRATKETSPRNFRPPSDVLSNQSKNEEVDSGERSQNENHKDISRRHSIFDEQPGKADRLNDTFTVGDHAVLENLGNITFRKSDRKENDEFSPFKADTRDSPSRISAHSKNDGDLSMFKTEARDMTSRNSAHSKKYDEFLAINGEASKMASTNSAHSKNGDDHVPFNAETKDFDSRNSAHGKNDDELSIFNGETSNMASRNSANSKNEDAHIPNKAESRDLVSRNSAHNKNDDEFSTFKRETSNMASRNSANSKNEVDHIPNKAESRDLASRNSAASKKDDEFSTFKRETSNMASRNSANSKNEVDHIPNKAESRDLASRNSAASKKDDEFSIFERETSNMASRNSANSKNEDTHIPNKEESRDLASRNSAANKNDDEFSTFKRETSNMASRNSAASKKDDEFSIFERETSNMASRNSANSKNEDTHIPNKAESRDLVSRNSAHNKNDDEFTTFKRETSNMVSRNSANSKNEDDHVPFKAEARDLHSRNSAQSKNDELLSHIKQETKDILSKHSSNNANTEDMFSF